MCEDRKSASRKRDTPLTGAFLRLFISPPECEAHWSCSSLPTTRPPEREREREADRERYSQTAYAAGY